MAAEYSRELGVKVLEGQKRLARLGWEQACKQDASLFFGLNVVEGKVVYPGVAEAFSLSLADAKSLL